MRKAALLDKKPLTATPKMLEMAKKTLEKRNRQSGIMALRRTI